MEQIHRTHIVQIVKNFSVLFLAIVKLLLCLIYKLNFIIGIACTGKNIVYIWFSIIQFQKFTVGLGFLWTKESTKYPTASVTSAL
jgi:hypothetical protein